MTGVGQPPGLVDRVRVFRVGRVGFTPVTPDDSAGGIAHSDMVPSRTRESTHAPASREYGGAGDHPPRHRVLVEDQIARVVPKEAEGGVVVVQRRRLQVVGEGEEGCVLPLGGFAE